jgi:hypothetical protein
MPPALPGSCHVPCWSSRIPTIGSIRCAGLVPMPCTPRGNCLPLPAWNPLLVAAFQVAAYTVNRREEAERLFALGVTSRIHRSPGPLAAGRYVSVHTTAYTLPSAGPAPAALIWAWGCPIANRGALNEDQIQPAAVHPCRACPAGSRTNRARQGSFCHTGESTSVRPNSRSASTKGFASGQLTNKEAARLEKGQERVQAMEDKAKADGKVTKKERARLEQAQNVAKPPRCQREARPPARSQS